MTRNQIAAIEAREKERANRAQEELAAQGQNKSLASSIVGSVFRGLATTLIPHPKSAVREGARTVHHAVHHYFNRRSNKGNKDGKEEGGHTNE